MANKWEFPGGKVKIDETKENALIREIRAELKSDIKIIKYLGVSNYRYEDLKDPFSISMYAYLCELVSGKLELTERISSLWATVEEMYKMNFAEADIPIINMLNN